MGLILFNLRPKKYFVQELNEICRHLASISIPLPALSINEDVKRALADGVDRLSDQILWLRQTWNIGV